jgi:hypothetical protein
MMVLYCTILFDHMVSPHGAELTHNSLGWCTGKTLLPAGEISFSGGINDKPNTHASDDLLWEVIVQQTISEETGLQYKFTS